MVILIVSGVIVLMHNRYVLLYNVLLIIMVIMYWLYMGIMFRGYTSHADYTYA